MENLERVGNDRLVRRQGFRDVRVNLQALDTQHGETRDDGRDNKEKREVYSLGFHD
jgi:hypothetical protein